VIDPRDNYHPRTSQLKGMGKRYYQKVKKIRGELES